MAFREQRLTDFFFRHIELISWISYLASTPLIWVTFVNEYYILCVTLANFNGILAGIGIGKYSLNTASPEE